jgi:hypothetical protein
MDGTMPAYRDMSPSDSAGQDVLELNRNLVKLGFNPDGIVVNETWQAATTAGVDALQSSLGETETGSLSLGQIVFLPGDQLVSTVQATLGSTGGGSQGNSSPNNAVDRVPAARPEFASLETHPPEPSRTAKPTGSRKPGRSGSRSLQALVALLEAEIAELKAASTASHSGSPSHGGSSSSPSSSSSNRGNSSSNGSASPSGSNSPSGSASPSGSNSPSGGNSSSSGSGGGSASAVLQMTSTQLIVTVDLDASKQSEATVGEPVTVQLPNGTTVDGRITAVSPVAQSSSNSGNGNGSSNNNGSNSNNNSNGNGSNNSSGSTIPVTITLQGHHAGRGLDQASVSVNFAQAQAKNVLSVPVTALLATGGGGYAVQEAAAPHRLIPVTTGLFAAGYVQISGPGIYAGLSVTDSQG